MTWLKVSALAIALISPTVVAAQSNCATRDNIVQSLESGYGEAFAGGGVQNSERIFEVWFNEEKGTWTILMTKADGNSCIMASGTNWQDGTETAKVPQGIPG